MVGKKRGSKKLGSKKSSKRGSRHSSRKGSRKISRKLKRVMPKIMQEMQILRKTIASENTSLSNGIPMMKLAIKIFKEASSNLPKAVELYKKYKQAGDIPKMHKKMQDELEANRKAKKAKK